MTEWSSTIPKTMYDSYIENYELYQRYGKPPPRHYDFTQDTPTVTLYNQPTVAVSIPSSPILPGYQSHVADIVAQAGGSVITRQNPDLIKQHGGIGRPLQEFGGLPGDNNIQTAGIPSQIGSWLTDQFLFPTFGPTGILRKVFTQAPESPLGTAVETGVSLLKDPMMLLILIMMMRR